MLAIAGALVTVAAAEAPSAIDTTITAQATPINGGSVACWDLAGDMTVPRFGRTPFMGEFCSILEPVQGTLREALTLVFSKAGGQFTITGGTSQPIGDQTAPPGTWSVTDATGHFASLSGSGVLTLASLEPPPPPAPTFTFTLAGTLTR